MKNKIYTCILLVALSSSCFASEKQERSQEAHTLNLSYSPVLRTVWYQEWKTVPPLKFTLNYTYDIPMRSHVVNFYAIGEASYIGGYHKDVLSLSVRDGQQELSHKKCFNTAILSIGIGLKVHLVPFLDLAVFYTGGYRYKNTVNYVERYEKWRISEYNYSGCAGVRLIGKIGKINVFAGYSLTHLLYEDFTYNKTDQYKVDHYVDIGIGYTF
ncbi:MAG: hypothetical protein K2I87_04485 [Bacteroidales bacterium]|nr:hypothetical protein [Bacteroidales bacterium]